MKILTILLLAFSATTVLAANDASIKGQQRADIKSSMNTHISNNTISGKYVIFDAITGELKKLNFKKLHDGVVKKGDFYVSCADFEDKNGKIYDLDFLVTPLNNGRYHVIQSLVHAVGDTKRAYHIEG